MTLREKTFYFSLKLAFHKPLSVESRLEMLRVYIDRAFDTPSTLHLEFLDEYPSIKYSDGGNAGHCIPAGWICDRAQVRLFDPFRMWQFYRVAGSVRAALSESVTLG